MPLFRRIVLITAIMVAAAAINTRADMEKIDELLKELDGPMPKPPVVLTINDCIDIAVENNQDLLIKLAILNSVEGDRMIDRSRFYSHVDFIGEFSRSQGSLSKTYAPSYNPQSVASLGTLDTSSYDFSSGGGSGGFDASSLAGVDMSQVSSLAAQYGIDISQYLQRRAPQTAADRYTLSSGLRSTQRTASLSPEDFRELMYQHQQAHGLFNTDLSPAMKRVMANRTASSDAGEDFCTSIGVPAGTPFFDQCVDSYDNAIDSINPFSSSSSDRLRSNNMVAVRYSQRLFEFGKDSSSSEQIRANRRLGMHNYQEKLREVISEVRTAFYTVILKKQQIETRQKLLGEYEEKLWQQQKRFEIAKDVPRIDVLTAELDVLNERNRINTLKSDLLDKRYDLLRLLDKPLDVNVQLVGDLQSLDYSIEDVVELTKEHSFHVKYLEEEYKEDLREFDELAWDYKPILSASFGYENRRTAIGLTLNNANQTYGMDLGVAQYINLPSESSTFSLSSSSEESNRNYSFSSGFTWNLYDNTHRKGIKKKHLEKLNEARLDLEQQREVEELNARKAYNGLIEARERLQIQQEIVDNAHRRLEITRKLREYGKVNEYQLDTYRDNFFTQQDRLFSEQENLIKAQEQVRRVMGVFE